jgi:hypothetical protein
LQEDRPETRLFVETIEKTPRRNAMQIKAWLKKKEQSLRVEPRLYLLD